MYLNVNIYIKHNVNKYKGANGTRVTCGASENSDALSLTLI